MTRKNTINEEISDKELLALIQKGSKDAFTIVYERFHRQLYTLAYRYLKDRTMSEDAVQHVFVKLWEIHSNLEVSISLKNYLYTMIKNHILNQIRNKNTAITFNYEIYQTDDLSLYEEGIIEAIENREFLDQFYTAINKLPDQKKTVCLLKLDGKFTNQEIADEMNLSVNTVKTHYAQALKILKQYLEGVLISILVILF